MAPYYNAELGDNIYHESPTVMAWSPGAPGAVTGISAGFTGEVLLMCMLTIYAGAHEKVKRSHYVRRRPATERRPGTAQSRPVALRRPRAPRPLVRGRADASCPPPAPLQETFWYTHHTFILWF